MSDLDGQDAFDKLLEVALDSRVDVRRAQDERDAARTAQREAERHMNEWSSKAQEFERIAQRSQPLLRELWEAAQAAHELIGPGGINAAIRLRDALNGANDYCDQPPF